jgi:hypothetical protein
MEKDNGAKDCLCPMCPTYFDCGEPLAFCLGAGGKSDCIVVDSGCICPGCPVQGQTGYQHVYYCTLGSEAVINQSAKGKKI